MSIQRYFRIIEHLDSIIREKATGSQKEFAHQMGMSRSLLNIYLTEMKELGFPISYCRQRGSYYYTREGKLVKRLFKSTTFKDVK